MYLLYYSTWESFHDKLRVIIMSDILIICGWLRYIVKLLWRSNVNRNWTIYRVSVFLYTRFLYNSFCVNVIILFPYFLCLTSTWFAWICRDWYMCLKTRYRNFVLIKRNIEKIRSSNYICSRDFSFVVSLGQEIEYGLIWFHFSCNFLELVYISISGVCKYPWRFKLYHSNFILFIVAAS